jgi:anti-anti-sigma regulatory factor
MKGVVLKIQRIERDNSVVFEICGRLEAGHGTELKKLLERERRPVVLDLRDVRLIERSAVEFLARWETKGVVLRNCSGYVREWISRERERVEQATFFGED